MEAEVPLSHRLIGSGLRPQGFKPTIAPAFLNPQESHQPTLSHEITPEPILYNLQNGENPKCLNILPATTPIPLTISILSTMCAITIRFLTRGRKFWLGYPHLNLKDGTTIFKPVELTRWETGSYKLRNIEIGLVTFRGVNLMAQPCIAIEVRGLARPILGKRRYTRGSTRIVNKL